MSRHVRDLMASAIGVVILGFAILPPIAPAEECPPCVLRTQPGGDSYPLASAPGYCPSVGGSHAYEYIQSVSTAQMGGNTLTISAVIYIANPTGCTYGQPCPEYDASPEYVNAWVDWDGDKTWETDERVLNAALTGYLGINYQGTMSTSNIVTIPEDAVTPVWMRVNLGWGYDPDNPCAYSWTWGDVIDREITITRRITENFPSTGYRCPDYGRPKDGDVDGDGRSDWFYEKVKSDDHNNLVELWGIDPSDLELDEYFAVILNSHYLIGKCVYGQGENRGSITYMNDSDGSGNPDQLLHVKWSSVDGGGDDVGQQIWPGFVAVAGRDKLVFELDVLNNELTVTHYDQDGNAIGSVTGPPAEPGGSYVFNGQPIADLQYDEPMFASPFEGEPLIYLTGSYSDYAVDTDYDGVLDILAIDAEVILSSPGYCVLKGRLVDLAGHEILWAETTASLQAGAPQTVTLMFDGNAIFEHGVNGPYYLNDVLVYHTGDPGQPHYVNQAYTTAPYRYIQFGLASMLIDIKPGGDPNPINPDSRGVVPVAILTTSQSAGEEYDFDAEMVDPESARFGPDEAHATQSAVEDVDGDGDQDMILHFRTQETGIHDGDIEACLTALTMDGATVIGCDAIVTVPWGTQGAPPNLSGLPPEPVPNASALLQNRPNPFRAETWIRYQLKEDADVVIRIYTATGKLVRTMELGRVRAGYYVSQEAAPRWDGRDGAGNRVGSGAYFYTIQAGAFSATGKMLMIK